VLWIPRSRRVLALDHFGVVAAVVLFVLAAVPVVDLVGQRRRSARARAHAGRDHRHDSLFEEWAVAAATRRSEQTGRAVTARRAR
jgi:hypothetical protein